MAHNNRFERHVKRQVLVSDGRTFFMADTAAAEAATSARAAAATRTTAVRTTAARTTTTPARARTTATTAAATTDTSAAVESSRANWRTRSTGTDTTTAAASSAATSNARNVASTASSSSGSSSASGAAASGSSSSSGAGTNGGAIAGAIIAVVVVLAAAVGGYFLWKKKKAARAARGSASGFVGGAGGGNDGYGSNGAAAAGGAYDKRHETGDSELFANSSASPNGSWNGEEKFGAMAGAGAVGAAGAYGAMQHGQQQVRDNDPWAVQQQQQQQRAVSPTQLQQQQHQSWAAPSFASSAPSSQPQYPPANVPGSTANLLGAGAGGPLAAPVPMNGNNGLTSSPFSDAHHSSIEQRELQQELDNRRMSLMNAAGAGAGAAAAGAAAAASSPFGESEGQGEIRIVKGTFDPSLEDELVLYPGDRVQVLMKYDDGWALGLNLNSGNPPAKGVFPFDCLGDLAPAPSATQIRAQSPQLPTTGPGAPRALSPALSSAGGASSPVPPALQPGSPDTQQQQRRQSMLQLGAPVNPANVPLPPPTPTPTTSQSGHGAGVLAPIAEDPSAFTAPSSSSRAPSPINTSAPPQLAPLTLGGGSDSPLAASFAPLSASAPAPSPTHETAGALAPVKQQKRHSSLIASRDADLFVALGEVLGDAEKEKEAQAKAEGKSA
ncbi:hypothetical protein JCM6882_006485 [Rhodosporidiobolus microsporus]